jgi:Kelch motif protein
MQQCPWNGLASSGGADRLLASRAEIYNPADGTWSPTGSMLDKRYLHTMTRLKGGRVLAVGGSSGSELNSAEVYDPIYGIWALTGSLSRERFDHTATLLPDGRVLVARGQERTGFRTRSVEIYDSFSGTWTAVTPMTDARRGHAAIRARAGVLVIGGLADFGFLSSAEIGSPGRSPLGHPLP